MKYSDDLSDANWTTINSDLGTDYNDMLGDIVIMLVVMKAVMGFFSRTMKSFKKCAHRYPCTTCKVRIAGADGGGESRGSGPPPPPPPF